MQSMAADEQVRILSALVPSYFRAHFAQIPSLSSQASYVLSQQMNADKLSNTKLGDMLRADTAATAALLQLASSPFYHRGQPVNSIEEAIVRVGRSEVFALMVSLATRSLFEPTMRKLYALLPHAWHRLQGHAVVCGFGVSWLADHLRLGHSDIAFVAGMFHDIGKLGALYCVCGLRLDEQIDFEISEESALRVLEATYVDIGIEMVSNWRLAEVIQNICAMQASTVPFNDPRAPLVHAIRVISHLDSRRDNAYVPPTLETELLHSVRHLNLDEPQLLKIDEKMQSITIKVAELLGKA